MERWNRRAYPAELRWLVKATSRYADQEGVEASWNWYQAMVDAYSALPAYLLAACGVNGGDDE